MQSNVSCSRIFAALTSALLFTSIPAWAQTVTMSPGANVQSAVDANPENTTFTFKPGIYRLVSIHPKNGDTFIGQSNPVLSGAQVLTNFAKSGNLYVIGGQTQQGQQNGVCDTLHPQCTRPEDLFYDGLPLFHVGSVSAVVPGAWYFDYSAGNIYMADNPAGHVVETSVTRCAFFGSANNVTIRGFVVEKYAIPAQFGAIGDQYPGQNWTVTNNEVRWNHGAGIGLASGSMARLNYVHHNGQKGIGGAGNNILVEGNKISFNNWAGFDPAWESGGAKFALTNNLTLRANSVHDNIGPGLWTDTDNINTLYENNVIENNNGGPGIQHEVSYAAIIRNNTVRNNTTSWPFWLWGSQILIQNSQNVQVYGNTVQTLPTGGNGIGIIQQYRGTGAYGPYLSINNYVHHNTIIYGGGVSSSGLVADYNQADVIQNGHNLFDYNAYHLTDPNWYHWNWGPGQTFAGMQQAGQELHGTADSIMPPLL